MFLESNYVGSVGKHQLYSSTFSDLVFFLHLKITSSILTSEVGASALWIREPLPTLEMTMKMKGLLKGLRYIAQIFDDEEEEEEQEMQIGLPTDVKHVAHIGLDGPSVPSAPSWMNEYQSGSESSEAAPAVVTKEAKSDTKTKQKKRNQNAKNPTEEGGAPPSTRQSRKKKTSKDSSRRGSSSRESSVGPSSRTSRQKAEADSNRSSFENDDQLGLNPSSSSCSSYATARGGSNIEDLNPVPTYKPLKLEEKF